jgi:hypothetical protein
MSNYVDMVWGPSLDLVLVDNLGTIYSLPNSGSCSPGGSFSSWTPAVPLSSWGVAAVSHGALPSPTREEVALTYNGILLRVGTAGYEEVLQLPYGWGWIDLDRNLASTTPRWFALHTLGEVMQIDYTAGAFGSNVVVNTDPSGEYYHALATDSASADTPSLYAIRDPSTPGNRESVMVNVLGVGSPTDWPATPGGDTGYTDTLDIDYSSGTGVTAELYALQDTNGRILRSTDGGANWGEPSLTGDSLNEGRVKQAVYTSGAERTVYNLDSGYTAPNIRCRTSANGGSAWGAWATFDPDAPLSVSNSYADILVTGTTLYLLSRDGTILTISIAGSRCSPGSSWTSFVPTQDPSAYIGTPRAIAVPEFDATFVAVVAPTTLIAFLAYRTAHRRRLNKE